MTFCTLLHLLCRCVDHFPFTTWGGERFRLHTAKNAKKKALEFVCTTWCVWTTLVNTNSATLQKSSDQMILYHPRMWLSGTHPGRQHKLFKMSECNKQFYVVFFDERTICFFDEWMKIAPTYAVYWNMHRPQAWHKGPCVVGGQIGRPQLEKKTWNEYSIFWICTFHQICSWRWENSNIAKWKF